MKTLGKFKNFLTSTDLYLENQTFWNDSLMRLSEDVREGWVSTRFANGEDFFDGNPIASALYQRLGKAVRIIQTAIDSTRLPVSAWLEKVEYQATQINELVIVVQPDDEAYHKALKLISFFLRETKDKQIQYVRAFNVWQKHTAGLKKTAKAIHAIDPYGTTDLVKSISRELQKKLFGKFVICRKLSGLKLCDYNLTQLLAFWCVQGNK